MSQPSYEKSGAGMDVLKMLKKEGVPEIILYMYEQKTARYSELKTVLKSEATLVRVLKILTKEGILTRELLDEKYRPTEYTITAKGERIGKRLKELLEV